jgi:hypothetical protein
MNWLELEHRLNLHCRKGGKTSRRRQADRVRQFVEFCRAKGVKAPDQVGKRHVYEWYESLPGASTTTLRDRYYAVRLFWSLIGRAGDPPRPPVERSGTLLDRLWSMLKPRS